MSTQFMSKPISKPSEDNDWLQIVRQKVDALRFGVVQIIVHEGRVTQIESTEKTRLESRPAQS